MPTQKELLMKEYPYRIEMHAHTSPVSTCSQILPEEMIACYKELGYHAIVITNHFMKDYLQGETLDEMLDFYLRDYETCRTIGEKEGIKVYLGAELRFTENLNDYLLYGVDRDMLKSAYEALEHGEEYFYRNIKSEKSIVFQAHPYRAICTVWDPSLIDGVEAFNLHPGHNANVGTASRYAEENGLLKIGGTDFHHPGQAGIIALRAKELPEDNFAFAELLRSGDYIMDVGGSLILP